MATRLILLILIFININYVVFADEKNFEILDKKNNYAKISILDKITSKKQTVDIQIKKKFKIQNFEIFVDRCIKDYRQGYLETLAHVQIKDTNIKSKNIVYIFNNWMFTSYPSLNSFDHPNFDIWLEKCS